ncbi:MAG: fumarylacetoacetate hydrolase family protein [Thalassobaculaceae bacterium]
MTLDLSAAAILPTDHGRAILIGRAWLPGQPGGPSVVTLREGQVIDLSRVAATIADVINAEDPVGLVRGAAGTPVGAIDAILANSRHTARDAGTPYMLPPIDLQAVKAAGVTFVESLLERVIEEQAKGDPAAAEEVRGRIQGEIGVDLTAIVPGSPEAMNLKEILVARGLWSAYLEVGVGPDAEVFTKAQPMSSVGVGAEIGLHPNSTWNNPEPELVLVIDARGRIVGVTLGNDVNLRDVEGRSALLLGRAKDNNGSTAIGPFVRLFDGDFTLDDARAMEISLRVEGNDGFVLEGQSSMAKIARDVSDLARQTIGPTHQYPDGLVLFTGTLFAPTQDRGAAGQGFTHALGDRVTIHAPQLGTLANTVNHSDKITPWTFGVGALMRNLATRGLLS